MFDLLPNYLVDCGVIHMYLLSSPSNFGASGAIRMKSYTIRLFRLIYFFPKIPIQIPKSTSFDTPDEY